MDFLKEITQQAVDKVSEGAKDSAIQTLNDPEFKAAINGFTRDFIYEHRVVIIATFGLLLALTTMATINVISNYQSNRRR